MNRRVPRQKDECVSRSSGDAVAIEKIHLSIVYKKSTAFQPTT
jgi:hypothetical protein